MKKKYESLDGLRTFACIGIVLMHVLGNGQYMLNGYVFEKVIPSLTNLVFLFMTISAFGMCCGYYDKFINHSIDWVDFYKKRYKKILPFFALLCILDYIISPSKGGIYELFANLTLCFGFIPEANITIIGVGWFLGTVFVFYLLFPFFCTLLSNKRKAWISLIIALIMNYTCRCYFNVGRKSIAFSFVFFMMGGIVFLYKEQIVNTKWVKWASLIELAICIFIFYRFYSGIIIMLLINAGLISFAISLSNRNILNNKLTMFIGGISFEIYLCHMIVFRILEKMKITSISNNGYISYLVAVLLVLLGSVIFSYLGNKMIKKTIYVLEKRSK